MPASSELKYTRIETISIILLSLATVLTSWCAFQSNQWSGEQYFRIDDETIADQFRLQMEVAGAQRQTAHLQMFLEYTASMARGEAEYAEFLFDRFPPELKTSVLAWDRLSEKEKSDSITSPFFMKEYSIPELLKAKEYELQATEYKKAANTADQHSDSYLLLSVLLSLVLFFCGIVGDVAYAVAFLFQ